MRLNKSACTNLLFPESRASISAFRAAAEAVRAAGFQTMEFYHDGEGRGRTGEALRDAGLQGVYIAVIPHKERKLHLCDVEPEGRKRALELAKACLWEAAGQGVRDVLFNSGAIREDNISGGLDALYASFCELYNDIMKKNLDLRLLMEPCDSRMDARQLIGPRSRTLDFMRRMDEAGVPLRLTLDSAHTVEEGEDFFETVRALKPWCNQIHYANCVTGDEADPLYGDKHVAFDHPGGVFAVSALRKLTGRFDALYAGEEPLRIGLEVLCREGEPGPVFAAMAKSVWGEAV